MRVLHIVPSAFNYFDQVRDQAFDLVEEEMHIGIDVEAFTLDYGPESKRLQERIKRRAPSRQYRGSAKLKDIIASFTEFDLIHVHCPLLGAAYEIVAYKKKFPGMPLVVSYHGKFDIPDLFGVFISWYNAWYLPKLFKAADVIVALAWHPAFIKNRRVIDLTPQANALQFVPDVSVYKALYSTLI